MLEDSSGAVTVTTAVWLGVAGIALAGLGIDGANLYRVKDALQQSSNRAAVAGAAQLATSLAAATSTAKQYSSDTTTPGLNSINGVQSVTATVATSCVWSLLAGGPTTAIPCPGTGANVVTVTQTATVNTFFGFGNNDDHCGIGRHRQWGRRRHYRESRCRDHSRYDGFDEKL